MEAVCGQRIFLWNKHNWSHVIWLLDSASSSRTCNCLHVSAVLSSTRRATRLDTLLWSTRICIPLRVWHWTGSSTTSTGPTRATEPSLWHQRMAAGDVCWSALIWANHEPSLWIQREGEQLSDTSHPSTAIQMTKPQKARLHLKVTEMIREAEAVEYCRGNVIEFY